jgi:hypothetical protein
MDESNSKEKIKAENQGKKSKSQTNNKYGIMGMSNFDKVDLNSL